MSEIKTALITGASGGIGAEYARIFAAEGYRVVLVARSEDKLRELEEELRRDFAQVITLPLDLTDPDAAHILHRALKEQGVQVDVLVNNAGYGDREYFLDSDWKTQEDMVTLNVLTVMHLSYLFAPSMVEREQGHILNTASAAAYTAGPNMATYYASKAFVSSFSQALAQELRGTGVKVTALCPGPVSTGFGKRANTKGSLLFSEAMSASAKRIARTGYRAMKRGRVLKNGGPIAYATDIGSRILPRFVLRKIVQAVNGKPQS